MNDFNAEEHVCSDQGGWSSGSGRMCPGDSGSPLFIQWSGPEGMFFFT